MFIACHQPGVVDAIAVAGREAHEALADAEAIVRPPQIDPTADPDSTLPYIRAARAPRPEWTEIHDETAALLERI